VAAVSVVTWLGLDHVADKSLTEALGEMTVTQLVGAVAGAANQMLAQVVNMVQGPNGLMEEIRPTLNKVDTVLDKAATLIDSVRIHVGKP
jgi:hypothetical protein